MYKLAWSNLYSRPARTILALLGLTVAIASMVGLFSVAEGMDRMVNRSFGQIRGLIALQPGAPIPLFSRLPLKWKADFLAVSGVRVVNQEIWQRVNLIDTRIVTNPPRFIFGTDIKSRLELQFGVYRDAIVAGRFLNESDIDQYRAVISRQIADQYQKQVGETMHLDGQPVEVVGIYDCDSFLFNVAIVLPIGTVRKMTRFEQDSVSSFYIDLAEDAMRETVITKLKAAVRKYQNEIQSQDSPGLNNLFSGLAGERKQPADKQSDHKAPDLIEIHSAMSMSKRFEQFSAELDIFLLVVTSIGLLVAMFGIINTMLMSVSERIVEFGILKANGWSRWDVFQLISYESAFLGFSGGLSGSLLGWLGTQFVNWNWPLRMNLYASPQLLLFSMCFSVVIGMLGGMYPALWAMRMMPMDAIRRG